MNGKRTTGFAYLASPYKHEQEYVRTARFWAACMAAARFMKQGYRVFSPIAHSHPIQLAGDLPQTWEFWREQDFPLLEVASELWVLQLDGWNVSTGVAAEIRHARALNIPIRFIEPTDEELKQASLLTAGFTL